MKVSVVAFYLGFAENIIGTNLDPMKLMQAIPRNAIAVIVRLENSNHSLTKFAHVKYSRDNAKAKGAFGAFGGFDEALYAV
jgi:hypothetical protein